jgi:hypothetical protein
MWTWKKAIRVEEPHRLEEFSKELGQITWGPANRTALKNTADALVKLIYQEVLYYYRLRKNHRLNSAITRGLAIVCATLGALFPVLAGAGLNRANPAYGFAFLIVAGGAMAWNRVFGATGGHIRQVGAQLALEALLTKFRLDWQEILAQNLNDEFGGDSLTKAFGLLHKLVDDAYKVIREETAAWAADSVSEMRAFEDRSIPRSAALGRAEHNSRAASGSHEKTTRD